MKNEKENIRPALESIIEMAIILGQMSDYNEVIRVVKKKALILFGADEALIMLVNPRTRQTIKTIYTKTDDPTHKEHILHSLITGWIMKYNRIFVSDHLQIDKRIKPAVKKNSSIRSCLAVPFKVEGIFIGCLLLANFSKDRTFSHHDIALCEYLTAVAAPFLRNSQKVEQYFANKLPEPSLIKKYAPLGLLGKSQKFIDLLKAIEAAAGCAVRVLLEGESGTGKELIVKAIHQLSDRSSNSFIAIDCGAIPANLIESELFGHVKGAFTGANTARKGLLEEAHGGTMFMDEISNLPIQLQAKLLRLLQEGEIRPLGSNQVKKVDVRIITASSVPLNKLVEEKHFREDLFYRLHVFPIEVPSLDERREDIPLLAQHFLETFANNQNKKVAQFHEELIDFMVKRHWPGNIRELENFIERLVTLAQNDANVLDTSILPNQYNVEWKALKKSKTDISEQKSLDTRVAEFETEIIRQALLSSNGNQSKAARILGVSEQTVRYKMSRYRIEKWALKS